MGRPKKEAGKVAVGDKASLRAQLDAVHAEIQRIHATDSPELINTAIRLAGLHARAWDLEGLLAEDVSVRLACARQSASWSEQLVRASKALQVDLLRDLHAKAEALQRHSSQMKGLK